MESQFIAGVEWRRSSGQVDYAEAVAVMESRAEAIRAGTAPELVWLLEHPPLYTAGTSADPAELLSAERFPVYRSGRGGRYTYHGPGQRVVYTLLDLDRRGRDVRRYVASLERWVIGTLAELGVSSRQEPGRIGIWVGDGANEAKIGAIGVRVRRWVTLHGFAINIDPDLSHFNGIVPCGIAEYGVTSLAAMGLGDEAGVQLDAALERQFGRFLDDISPAAPST